LEAQLARLKEEHGTAPPPGDPVTTRRSPERPPRLAR
jgi:hypothetical protein